MFYMLVNIHHHIAAGDMLLPPDRFWHYLLDLPSRIWNAATSFQMELEHLIGREAPQSPILSGAAGTNVPSLRAFLESLLGEGPEYNSDSIYSDASSRMSYHISNDDQSEEATGLTPPNLSSRSRATYLIKKEQRLWSL
jgi:hypothetical protein